MGLSQDTAVDNVGGVWWRALRTIIVSGVIVGVLIGGIGSRLAMLLLRVTSADSVIGVTSDDGFRIGRFSPADSYGLLQLGAIVGVIGGLLYVLVRPWLIGPRWFRHLTVGLACGAVVGSMLLHADGVDFRLLTPTWLAIGLFIAIPFLFGLAIGPMHDAIERRPVARGWRQFTAPALALSAGPGAAFGLLVIAPVLFIIAAGRVASADRTTPTPTALKIAIRGALLGIAMLGFTALLNDISAITSR